MNGKQVSETIVKYSLSPEVLYPKELSCDDVRIGRYDLISVIFINLGATASKNTLLGMLSTLLSPELSVDEKKDTLENVYDFPMTEEMEKEAAAMCNLSDLIAVDKDAVIAKKEAEIADKEAVIADKEAENAALKDANAKKDAEIAALKAQIAAQNHS